MKKLLKTKIHPEVKNFLSCLLTHTKIFKLPATVDTTPTTPQEIIFVLRHQKKL